MHRHPARPPRIGAVVEINSEVFVQIGFALGPLRLLAVPEFMTTRLPFRGLF